MIGSPGPLAINVSFFDDATLNDRPRFWLETIPLNRKKPSTKEVFEGELIIDGGAKHVVITEDRMITYASGKDKTKHEGFVFLDMVRVEVLKSDKGGFRLISNLKTTEIMCPNAASFETWHRLLRDRCTFRDFNVNYTIIKAIGKGSFAMVYQATKNADSKEYAVKSFDKRKIDPNSKNKLSLMNEITMMRAVDHPHIIKLYEVYETDNHINLVVELLKGGELFDKIVAKGHYTEKDAADLMKKLLSALDFLATKKIMHRDLKPENLILYSTDDDTNIKIADFGLATYIDLEEQLFKRCGTPGYVAPEVLADQPYNTQVDIYSAGLILFILITGASPFFAESYNEILKKNKKAEIDFTFDDCDQKPSALAAELMKKMLEKDPKNRFTARECLMHPWFGGGESGANLVGTQASLRKYQEEKKLKLDLSKRKEAARADNLVTNSPLLNGRTDSIEEEKGKTWLDSPSMRPKGVKKEIDIRKQAILKNAANYAGSPGGEGNHRPLGSPKLEKGNLKGDDSEEERKEGAKRSSFATPKSPEVQSLSKQLKKMDK